MVQNYIAGVIDKDKNNVYPQTMAAAIQDAQEKLVTTTGDQLNISGTKNFTGNLTVRGKSVLTDMGDGGFSSTPVAIADCYGINKSGDYFYNVSTLNKPVTAEGSQFGTGYIRATFNNADNGVIYFFGTGAFIEKYKGAWMKYFYPYENKKAATVTDCFAINQSGEYYYTEAALNKPTSATGSFANGYIKAIFRDTNNGVLQFMGTGAFVEKFGGKWRDYVYPKA